MTHGKHAPGGCCCLMLFSLWGADFKAGDWCPGTIPSPCIRAVSPTAQPHLEYSVIAQSAFTEWVGGCWLLQGTESGVNGLSERETMSRAISFLLPQL